MIDSNRIFTLKRREHALHKEYVEYARVNRKDRYVAKYKSSHNPTYGNSIRLVAAAYQLWYYIIRMRAHYVA